MIFSKVKLVLFFILVKSLVYSSLKIWVNLHWFNFSWKPTKVSEEQETKQNTKETFKVQSDSSQEGIHLLKSMEECNITMNVFNVGCVKMFFSTWSSLYRLYRLICENDFQNKQQLSCIVLFPIGKSIKCHEHT